MAKKKKEQISPKSAVNYLLIDDSGSMNSRAPAVQKGISAYIIKLKAEVPDSKMVIIYFGSSYKIMHAACVKDITDVYYNPMQQSTALYSSVSSAVKDLMRETADYKSLVIATDGLDNVSPAWAGDARICVKNARKADIMIGLLATGIDAKGVACDLGIDQDLTSNFASDNAEAAIGTMSDVTSSYSKGHKRGLTTLEREVIEKSPEQIAKTEGETLVTLVKLQKLLTKMYEEDAGQFFSVCFKSRTPPYKTRTYGKARFNVPSQIKGDAGKGAAYSPLEKKLVACYVLDKHDAESAAKAKKKEGDVLGFRSVPLEGIIALRAGGKAFRVKTGG